MRHWETRIRLVRAFVIFAILIVGEMGCHKTNRGPSSPAQVPPRYHDNSQSIPEDKSMTSMNRRIDETEAIAIVERHVEKENNGELIPVCEVEKTQSGFKVYVQYGTKRDSSGRVTGFFPGGHAVFILSREGEIEQVIGGA